MGLHFGLYVFVFGLPIGDRTTYESDAMSQKKTQNKSWDALPHGGSQ